MLCQFEISFTLRNNVCGIFGSISAEASSDVLQGLRKLEYRGYDSAGLSAILSNPEGSLATERTTGFVSELTSKVDDRFSGSTIAIGHTRWATHGGVTNENAHPHSSNDGKISIVHNGIIENATDLLEDMRGLGYQIKSETDSEVIVHLFDYELKNQSNDKTPLDAFASTIAKLEGYWAIAAIISGYEGILAARCGSPLVIGRNKNSIFISSDVQPFFGLCSEVSYPEESSILSIKGSGVECYGAEISLSFVPLEGEYSDSDPGIFPHMMLKEIHEQPVSIANTLGGRISADGERAQLGGISLDAKQLANLERINIVSCGSAFFASQIGVEILRRFSQVPISAFQASEFPASSVCSANTLTIGVSQSGETKDTLDALKDAKEEGSHISSFCNVIGSTMSRLTSNGAYLHSGPEFAVASTKTFTSMIAVFSLLALTIPGTRDKGRMDMISELRRMPNKLTKQLMSTDDSIQEAANLISSSESAIFVGRGISSPLSKEGALKMMEIAYIPSLSFPGGELKHGPIALIEEGTPVIAISPSDGTTSLMESTIRECQSRGARIILISDSKGRVSNLADIHIPTLKTHPCLSPIINSIPLQLLSYEVGILRETEIDRPRNLAKSVTVS